MYNEIIVLTCLHTGEVYGVYTDNRQVKLAILEFLATNAPELCESFEKDFRYHQLDCTEDYGIVYTKFNLNEEIGR